MRGSARGTTAGRPAHGVRGSFIGGGGAVGGGGRWSEDLTVQSTLAIRSERTFRCACGEWVRCSECECESEIVQRRSVYIGNNDYAHFGKRGLITGLL